MIVILSFRSVFKGLLIAYDYSISQMNSHVPQRFAGYESNCKCIYNHLVDKPVTMISTIMDFIFSVIVVVSGLITNYRYRKKLKEEKRNRPPDRKGNVIEPIMRWYLNFGIIYWPYQMLFLWINANEVMPSEWFKNCILIVFINLVRIGRTIIAYNSFFTALIRYLYIVHHHKANQWNFEYTGKIFQWTSFGIPLILEVIRLFTESSLKTFLPTERFQTCLAINEGLTNSTGFIDVPTPRQVVFAQQALPKPALDSIFYAYAMVTGIIGSNVIEAYFYVTIFQNIKRSVGISNIIQNAKMMFIIELFYSNIFRFFFIILFNLYI